MARLSARKKAVLERMTRDSLISAVEKLLQEEGWKGATMDRIAKEAGVSKGTVYNYFKDKRDILFSVMERNTEEIREFVRSVDLSKSDPVDLLRKIVGKTFMDLYEKRKLISATVQAYYEDKDLRRKIDPDHACHEDHPMREVRKVIAEVIAMGVRSGVFRPIEPAMAEAAINAMTMGVAKQFAAGIVSFPGEVYVYTVRDLVIRGLLVD
jgi:AcrR family transcriptional regulator